MSNKTLCIFAALVCFLLSPICCIGQNDFKNLTWGMSYDDVFKIVNLDNTQTIITSDDNTISVRSTLSNCKAWWIYYFTNSKLYGLTGALYQPYYMNCEAKLWQRYALAQPFFATLEEKGFINRSRSITYDKKQINTGEKSPFVNKEVINYIENKIQLEEQKKLSDNPGLRFILNEFIVMKLYNTRSNVSVSFLSPLSMKTRCDAKITSQDPSRRDLLQFSIRASEAILNQLNRKSF